jgi:hypothetical protein
MIHLPRVLEAAVEVQRFCLAHRWPFCFIGGVAVQRWGEPRVTQDVDLTILAELGNEEPVADALLGGFLPRRRDACEFAVRHRVLLLRTAGGIDVGRRARRTPVRRADRPALVRMGVDVG